MLHLGYLVDQELLCMGGYDWIHSPSGLTAIPGSLTHCFFPEAFVESSLSHAESHI